MKLALVSGAIFMALAVAFGAFGAHTLKEMVSPSDLLTFEKAVRYHFWHALGLLVIGAIGFHVSYDVLIIPVYLIMFGIIFFSGILVFIGYNKYSMAWCSYAIWRYSIYYCLGVAGLSIVSRIITPDNVRKSIP
jgi:uncharacterized membrane protein YgdD (TMEM256/DUF423 family)